MFIEKSVETTLFSYLESEIGLFQDREDPKAVYVIIKNRLQDCLLKDFHLANAINLATRLYHALPDHYLNARQYVDEVRKILQQKVGDHTFTRKMGLNISSMLLGAEHQRKFDCLMARIDESPILKEPFDREIRGKMMTYQKQTLDGMDKFQPLGALSKKNTELLGMYTTNKMPVKSTYDRPDRKRKSTSDTLRRSNLRNNDSREKRSRAPPEKEKRHEKRVSARPTSRPRAPPTEDVDKVKVKGEKKVKISKVNRRDLQRIIDVAVSLSKYYLSYT